MHIESKLPHVGETIFSVMSAAAQRYGAVNLSQGFPNYNPPERLMALVNEHIRRGANQYAPMPGHPLLRRRIADKMQALYGLPLDPDAEITITAGATQALFCAIAALVRPGDEVILLELATTLIDLRSKRWAASPCLTLCGRPISDPIGRSLRPSSRRAHG